MRLGQLRTSQSSLRVLKTGKYFSDSLEFPKIYIRCQYEIFVILALLCIHIGSERCLVLGIVYTKIMIPGQRS